MTGLNPRTDKILEIAVIITDGNLEAVDEGLQYVIRTDAAVLNGMNEWCTTQHGKSGLTEACLTSPHSHTFVANSVLAYIKRWIPEQTTACLAGNSVHADRAFLEESMPEITQWLHYRSLYIFILRYNC
ncbi:hypothetical protein C0991_011720 [Blastosporella zonata]|nr:hypothetical protein C0991_011720 [Blastosporella zonata]